MSTYGDIGRLRQEKYKNSFQFSQSFSILPKPAGAQGAHGSQGPLLARAQGPLGAQVSYY